jgi:ribosomal protein L12E/L44/L45/RPP1/RPP2
MDINYMEQALSAARWRPLPTHTAVTTAQAGRQERESLTSKHEETQEKKEEEKIAALILMKFI